MAQNAITVNPADLVSTSEVNRIAGRSCAWITMRLRTGQYVPAPVCEIEGRRFYDRRAIQAWLASLEGGQ